MDNKNLLQGVNLQEEVLFLSYEINILIIFS